MLTDADLARLSQRAYTDVPTWSRGDVQACRTDCEDGITVVAFPGTHDIADVLRDLRAWPVRDPRLGYCHAGIRDGALALAHQIALDTAGRRLVLTGHSLGGGYALVVGALFAADHMAPAAIVTFGAPRPGFATLARLLRPVPRRLYRNGNDPVPCVPWLMGLYRTPGATSFIGRPRPDPIQCHFIERYIEAPVPALPVL
jgi:hypothetical protein